MGSVVANLIEVCPICGTELARAKYLEVQRKLREQDEERAKKATAEALKEANKVLDDERRRATEQQAAAAEKAKGVQDALKKKGEQQREALQKALEAMAKLKVDKTELKAREA